MLYMDEQVRTSRCVVLLLQAKQLQETKYAPWLETCLLWQHIFGHNQSLKALRIMPENNKHVEYTNSNINFMDSWKIVINYQYTLIEQSLYDRALCYTLISFINLFYITYSFLKCLLNVLNCSCKPVYMFLSVL